VLVTRRSYISLPTAQTFANRSDGSDVREFRLFVTSECLNDILHAANPASHALGVSAGLVAVNVVVTVVVVVDVVVVMEALTGQFIKSDDSPAKRKFLPTT